MAGPVAPKDPTAKRAGFYILLEKEICGSPQEDGRGIHPIYLDMGRLISAAKLVGHIEDEEMINCLKTTAGFRKMVHSIGVTIVMSQPMEDVKFVFQMYGINNRRYEATNLEINVPTNGVEQILPLSEVSWSSIDDEPGQMRFEFPKAGSAAVGSVKLYLNDGFTAPPVETEFPVDYEAPDYKEMVKKSLLSVGNTTRLQRFLEKTASGEATTVAFIGGSITQGAGATPINTECYAYKTYCEIVENYSSKKNVTFIKAGVGGTSSELGTCRYDRDVLRQFTEEPDLVFIEFAVNDEGDETKGVFYESLIAKALDASNAPAVVLIFSVFADDFNLQERLAPIGTRYQLPMTSVKDAVCSQFGKRRGEGGVLTKNQYFYDMFHPCNVGHIIMKDCIMYLLESCKNASSAEVVKVEDIKPYKSREFKEVHSFARSDYEGIAKISCGSFTDQDKELQCVEPDVQITPIPVYPDNWKYSGHENSPFTVTMKCKALILLFKDSDKTDFGKADILLDGNKLFTIDPREVGWIHANAKVIFSEKESREHTITIKMAEGEEEKFFTILGFGYCI